VSHSVAIAVHPDRGAALRKLQNAWENAISQNGRVP
jgi:hypothetical protein